MKSRAQLEESIERFQTSFWQRRRADRPPVGVACDGVWLPIHYLREEFPRDEVLPEDVRPERVMTDYEFGFAHRPVRSDDFFPFSAAWRAIPWLEVCCGCRALYAEGSLAPSHVIESLEALAAAPIPADNDWLDCLRGQTQWLAAHLPEDAWASPSILRGPSDVLAALRGLSSFFLDLYDGRELVRQTAGRINQLLIRALDLHYEVVGPKLGGYVHIFGYWAPGRTYVIQEDAMGMASPRDYREVFFEHNAEVVRHFGDCIFFHVHSTGFQHYRDVLAMPGLAGMEFTIEAKGPPLLELVPVLREILERGRLILCIDHGFEALPAALRKLPHEGLYVVINDRFIGSEEDFGRFIAANWPGA